MTAPDRIWIDAWGGNWSPVSGGTQNVEYIRADLATPAAMTPEVRALVEAAAKTRAAQKAYFRDRTRENLIASKQAEAELDAALRAGGDG